MDTNHEKGFDVDLIMCDGTKIRKKVKAIAIPSKINHAMIINDMSPENALNQKIELCIDHPVDSDYGSSFITHHKCANAITLETAVEKETQQVDTGKADHTSAKS